MATRDGTWWNDTDFKALAHATRDVKGVLSMDTALIHSLEQRVATFLPMKTAALLPGYLLRVSRSQAHATALDALFDTAKRRNDAMLFLHQYIDHLDRITRATGVARDACRRGTEWPARSARGARVGRSDVGRGRSLR